MANVQDAVPQVRERSGNQQGSVAGCGVFLGAQKTHAVVPGQILDTCDASVVGALVPHPVVVRLAVGQKQLGVPRPSTQAVALKAIAGPMPSGHGLEDLAVGLGNESTMGQASDINQAIHALRCEETEKRLQVRVAVANRPERQLTRHRTASRVP